MIITLDALKLQSKIQNQYSENRKQLLTYEQIIIIYTFLNRLTTMQPQSSAYIPQINISAVLQHGVHSQLAQPVINSIHRACKQVGFFSIVGHSIEQQFIQRMLQKIKEFHYLPQEKKLPYASHKWNPLNKNRYRGYFPSTVNGKEGYDITDPLFDLSKSQKKQYHYEQNILPQDLSSDWISTIEQYYSRLHNIAIVLMEIVFKAFDKSENLKSLIPLMSRPECLSTLRFNYYPEHKTESEAVEISAQDGAKLACETHHDSTVFTILFQDSEGGLQVKNSNDGKWYNVPFNKRAYVVNTGKTMQILTNGHYKATVHRVLYNRHERISIPFFYEFNSDLILDSTYLVDEERKYQVERYGDFLKKSLRKFKEYQREEKQKNE